jgi:hypothetical protein
MKTEHKSVLVIAVLLLSGIAINTSTARESNAGHATGSKDIRNLAPVIPIEADFNEDDINMIVDIQKLAPVIPIEADFNDGNTNLTFDLRALAPTTPVEADFLDSV